MIIPMFHCKMISYARKEPGELVKELVFLDPASTFLYLFFLMCSAYFACAETAYTAVSKVRLRTLADKGNKRAQKALWICERFDKTLTTILVGNNIFHFFTKSSTFRGEKKRAVPLVGRTWLGPAK